MKYFLLCFFIILKTFLLPSKTLIYIVYTRVSQSGPISRFEDKEQKKKVLGVFYGSLETYTRYS